MTNVINQSDLNYKIQVEPAIFAIINQVAQDVARFDISPDQFIRAVWTWADKALDDYDAAPQWLLHELAKAQQAREARNTIDGEAGR
jgi:hypothetical protein